ncbi:putative oxidoreductase YdgJ [Anaerolineales bacterium]|nr:putative oxidoreductase YdgJ [Anaerolineales bacterium]
MHANRKINVAVIGLGWVATNRHIQVILRNPRLHLYGIVDKRPERIKSATEKYPWIRTSVSQEGEMPWGKDVQAVVIATDPLNHYTLAKKMLMAGKHVLMEKPLTMSVEESRDLQEISSRTGMLCCVVHNFQFARSTLRLKQMILEGNLGEIQSIEAIQLSNPRRRLPTWYEQLPFGLFYDESPHMFYMLESLAGREIQHIASTVIHKDGQNTPLSVSGHYSAGDIPVRLSMNFNASLSEWHIAVMGSKGIGIVDVFRDILVTMPNDGLHRAREILTSSGSLVFTHLWGFFKSGILLARGRLFYGSDMVWERFTDGLEMKHHPIEISVVRGLRIVELQHEIMNKSMIFKLAADENSGN